jgi:hypothetical protein
MVVHNLKATFFYAIIKIMPATSRIVTCYIHLAAQFFCYKCSESLLIESQLWDLVGS